MYPTDAEKSGRFGCIDTVSKIYFYFQGVKKLDDIYFSDRKNQNKRRNSGAKDKFSNETPIAPSGRLRDENRSDSDFVVHIPKSEGEFSKSRTPKGRPVSQSESREKSGESSFVPEYKPKASTEIYSDAPRSRTPSGRPVGTQNSVTPPLSSSRTPAAPTQKARQPEPVKMGGKKGKNIKTKKKLSGGKIAGIIFAVLVLLLGGLFAYGYSILGKVSYDTKLVDKNEYISESKLYSSEKVRNILFIGSDARGDISGQRSDTMMLFSIDKNHKKLKLTSFLRDSYVCIPSSGYYNKLNASFSFGGVQLAIDTLEYNFRVKIDDYILVDFDAFEKFINLLGGLTIEDVTKEEAKYLRDVVKIKAKAGTNHFNGWHTLWYCRIRYLDDDFNRTARQRKVISAIIKQVSKTNPIKLMKIMEEVLPMIQTNISRNELVSLAVSSLGYLRYDVMQHRIPATGTWSNKTISGVGDVLYMDFDENIRLLKEFVFDADGEEETTKN